MENSSSILSRPFFAKDGISGRKPRQASGIPNNEGEVLSTSEGSALASGQDVDLNGGYWYVMLTTGTPVEGRT